jgi:hypothetical protein
LKKKNKQGAKDRENSAKEARFLTNNPNANKQRFLVICWRF